NPDIRTGVHHFSKYRCSLRRPVSVTAIIDLASQREQIDSTAGMQLPQISTGTDTHSSGIQPNGQAHGTTVKIHFILDSLYPRFIIPKSIGKRGIDDLFQLLFAHVVSDTTYKNPS